MSVWWVEAETWWPGVMRGVRLWHMVVEMAQGWLSSLGKPVATWCLLRWMTHGLIDNKQGSTTSIFWHGHNILKWATGMSRTLIGHGVALRLCCMDFYLALDDQSSHLLTCLNGIKSHRWEKKNVRKKNNNILASQQMPGLSWGVWWLQTCNYWLHKDLSR